MGEVVDEKEDDDVKPLGWWTDEIWCTMIRCPFGYRDSHVDCWRHGVYVSFG